MEKIPEGERFGKDLKEEGRWGSRENSRSKGFLLSHRRKKGTGEKGAAQTCRIEKAGRCSKKWPCHDLPENTGKPA